jgi:hypothetical protein
MTVCFGGVEPVLILRNRLLVCLTLVVFEDTAYSLLVPAFWEPVLAHCRLLGLRLRALSALGRSW